ncbi:hypothetical protein MTR67_035177 [Solanum verrucosum]|uniref:Uncharacterized protein n=1 Tax=Solanum verrucosum TaxID=315347 RepID=A0AAF0ZK05_SOLVR|nr:hypothetical protein MTR67_035177 [Solanum verrucosum]
MVNAVGEGSRQCPEDDKFEELYNKEVNYIGNQLGDSHSYYPRSGGNQGRNKDQDNDWRDWRDGGDNWRDREAEKIGISKGTN